MRFHRDMLRLYAVTDRSWTNEVSLRKQVEQALRGGITMLQLREKSLDEAAFEQEARELKKLCADRHIPFIINDNVALAERVDADGVHIGQSDMELKQARALLGPDKIIGVTAKTVEQAKAACAGGADYLGSGAAFGSSTKPDAIPMSRDLLRRITESVPIPVVAIGGIHAGNAAGLAGCGIAGIAVVSGIFAANDIEEETKRLRAIADSITSL